MSYEKIQVIREWCPSSDSHSNTVTAIIRTQCYGSTVGFFNFLAENAQRDFPEVTPEDMEVCHYGGDGAVRRGEFGAKTYGIEMWVSRDSPALAEYTEVEYVRSTL